MRQESTYGRHGFPIWIQKCTLATWYLGKTACLKTGVQIRFLFHSQSVVLRTPAVQGCATQVKHERYFMNEEDCTILIMHKACSLPATHVLGASLITGKQVGRLTTTGCTWLEKNVTSSVIQTSDPRFGKGPGAPSPPAPGLRCTLSTFEHHLFHSHMFSITYTGNYVSPC